MMLSEVNRGRRREGGYRGKIWTPAAIEAQVKKLGPVMRRDSKQGEIGSRTGDGGPKRRARWFRTKEKENERGNRGHGWRAHRGRGKCPKEYKLDTLRGDQSTESLADMG